MSGSLEFNPVPAHELARALYQEKEAQLLYESMTPAEKEKTNYIMSLLRSRLQATNRPYVYTDDCMKRLLLRKPLVVENFISTEKIRMCLDCLGYESEQVHTLISPVEASPTLIVKR